MGFFNIHQGFRTISRVFNIISKVFNIFSNVVASRFKLVGTGTLSMLASMTISSTRSEYDDDYVDD